MYMLEKDVKYIVLHCSATRSNQAYTVEQLTRDHQARGFRTVGYHFYIRQDGSVTQHRKLLEAGAHAMGYNHCSIGICYEGGLDVNGNPCDTRTEAQKRGLLDLFIILSKMFPEAKVVGHCELPHVHKACPCIDMETWRKELAAHVKHFKFAKDCCR